METENWLSTIKPDSIGGNLSLNISWAVALGSDRFLFEATSEARILAEIILKPKILNRG